MPEVYVAGDTQSKGESESVPAAESPKQEVTPSEIKEKNLSEVRQLVSDILDRVGEKPRKVLGGAYTVRPDGRFLDEQEDEEVVLLLRAHPITNLGWILILTVALLVAEILIGSGIFAGFPGKFVLVGRLAAYLLVLGFAFQKFIDWYYSVLIITNERVINVDFINLLYRVITYAALNHIEEPSMVAGGFIRSFFRYGDLFIETAAEIPSIEAVGIPYPDKVIRIISELSEELEKRRELGK